MSTKADQSLKIEDLMLPAVRVVAEQHDDVHTLRTIDRRGATIHIGRGYTATEAFQDLDGRDMSHEELKALREKGY